MSEARRFGSGEWRAPATNLERQLLIAIDQLQGYTAHRSACGSSDPEPCECPDCDGWSFCDCGLHKLELELRVARATRRLGTPRPPSDQGSVSLPDDTTGQG